MNWKGLIAGIALIVLIALAGLLYRNASETVVSNACTADAKVCPDGTAVGRTGPNCSFAPCAPPNVELASSSIAYVLPSGFSTIPAPDGDTIASYGAPTGASTTDMNEIIIRDYPLPAGAPATEVIDATALGDASGAPISPAAFSSVTIGSYHYTTASLGRFEGVVHVVYYLSRQQDVLRFDAIDKDVMNWTDPSLNVSALPAASALRALLGTLTQ